MNAIQITQIDANELEKKFEHLNNQINVLTNLVSKNAKPKDDKQYYTIRETSKLLSVSKVTLHKWKHKGLLVPMKIGGRPLYKREDIDKVLLQSTQL